MPDRVPLPDVSPPDIAAGAGALPPPEYIEILERMLRERNQAQGLPPPAYPFSEPAPPVAQESESRFLPERGHGNWPRTMEASIGGHMRYNTSEMQGLPYFPSSSINEPMFAKWLTAQPRSANVEDVTAAEQPQPQPGERLVSQGYRNVTPTLESQGRMPDEMAMALGYFGMDRFGPKPDPRIQKILKTIKRLK